MISGAPVKSTIVRKPELGRRMLQMASRGMFPVVLRDGKKLRLVPVNLRAVLSWVEIGERLPLRCLIAFSCMDGLTTSAKFTELELERLKLLTSCYLRRGYIQPQMLTPYDGQALYLDWLNTHGYQLSMGTTDAQGKRLQTSMRVALPSPCGYLIHDLDRRGQKRIFNVHPLEVPMHALLSDADPKRGERLEAEHRVHIVGEMSQLASARTDGISVIKELCQLFAAFARATVADQYRDELFRDGMGIALATSSLPQLAEILAHRIETRLKPELEMAARVSCIQVGQATWRLGTEEVPLLLVIHPLPKK